MGTLAYTKTPWSNWPVLVACHSKPTTAMDDGMARALQLRVLGAIDVLRDGESVTLPQSRKTRALLAYLALTGRAHSRDRLISLFWDIPDDPRAALRWSLSKLRGVLNDDGCERLQASREAVELNLEDVEVDCFALTRMVAGGLAEISTDELLALSEACEGEMLAGLDLPNCQEYQFWLVAQRGEFEAQKALLNSELAQRFAEEPLRALPFARALVDHDPFDEHAQTLLVTKLWRAGYQPEAEAQYRRALAELEEAGEPAEGLKTAWKALGAAPPVRPAPAQAAGESTGHAPVVASAAQRPGPGDTPGSAVLRRPAVAVLPFDNMSDDREQEYFADGIADDIITALSQWRWFPVIARHSSFAFRNRVADIPEVGRELGVRYIVQGSVRKAGNRVRVIAQLVDAGNGLTLWAQRYDRELDDIFALQDEIAEQIACHIEPQLARIERDRKERVAPKNLDVWDLNLRALDRIYRGTKASLEEAQALIERSLKLEPENSYTHAMQAYALYHQALLVWTTSDPGKLARTYLDTARRAVELDEENWLGHALLGMSVLWGERDYDTAETAEQRAIALNPTAPLAHQFMGCVCNFGGQPARALPHLQTALRLNPGPTSATLQLSDMALAYLLLGELDKSVSHARRALSAFSGNMRAWERLTAALGAQGRAEEAAETYTAMVNEGGVPNAAYLDMTYPFRDQAHREILMSALRKAGLPG
jgi:TolB-like protein